MVNSPFFVDESSPWFTKEAGWPDEVPKNIDFPKITLGQMLRAATEKWPSHKAIWFMDTYVTFKELDQYVDNFAASLGNLGIKKGDVVAILLPNSIQYVVTFYAIARIGAIATGCNPMYKPAEILHQLKLTNAKAIVALDALYESIVGPIYEKSPLDIVISTNILDMASGISGIKKFLGRVLKKVPTGPVPGSAKQFKSMLKTASSLPKVDIDADDTATYIMTGGTTGVPKAAILSHFNCVSNAIQSRHWLYKIKPGAASLGILPLFHSFAMTCVMNICINIGGCMILVPKPPPMEELIPLIIKLSPPEGMMFAGAEVLFQRIADWPQIENYDLSGKLQLCVSGAGPLHRPVQEKFEKVTNARLVEGYGLTESSPVCSAGPFWGNRKIGTIGLPFPGTDWKIVDSADPNKSIEIGETGEIAIAGPNVMVGYLNQPEETAETIVTLKDGKKWLLTGDIGRMDIQGRITIEDRKKQLIKYKGWSVFPTEVETLLLGHEAISEVAVAGLPDSDSNEIIKAWVVLKPDFKDKVDPAEIKAWAKENLTFYKVPTFVELIDELPKTMVGKVLRRVLQEKDPIWIKIYGKKKDEL